MVTADGLLATAHALRRIGTDVVEIGAATGFWSHSLQAVGARVLPARQPSQGSRVQVRGAYPQPPGENLTSAQPCGLKPFVSLPTRDSRMDDIMCGQRVQQIQMRF